MVEAGAREAVLAFLHDEEIWDIADPNLKFSPLVGQMVLVDTTRSSDIDEELVPNILNSAGIIDEDKLTYPAVIFAMNLGYINQIMLVAKTEGNHKNVLKYNVAEIEFEDKIKRDRLKPLQTTFVEDRTKFFPCIAYNMVNKQIKTY